MYNRLMRYNKPVILSLMCQHCINSGEMVTAKLVQRWLRVSKPTALDVLNELVVSGHVERFTKQWRPNARVYYFRPQKSIFDRYRRGEFRDAFKVWAYGEAGL